MPPTYTATDLGRASADGERVACLAIIREAALRLRDTVRKDPGGTDLCLFQLGQHLSDALLLDREEAERLSAVMGRAAERLEERAR